MVFTKSPKKKVDITTIISKELEVNSSELVEQIIRSSASSSSSSGSIDDNTQSTAPTTVVSTPTRSLTPSLEVANKITLDSTTTIIIPEEIEVEEEVEKEEEEKEEEEEVVVVVTPVVQEFDQWAEDALGDWAEKAAAIHNFVNEAIKDRNQLAIKKEQERKESALNPKKRKASTKITPNNNNKKKGDRKKKSKSSKKASTSKTTVDDDDDNDQDEEEIEVTDEPAVDYSLDLSKVTATLREYQLAGVRWLVTLHENGMNGILADEMGLGKTLQTIAFLSVLSQRGYKGLRFVVCPKSVLHVWKDEIARFCPSLDNFVYEGNPEERATLRQEFLGFKSANNVSPDAVMDPPIIITSYEILVRDTKFFKKMRYGEDGQGISLIVVDESHKLKNPKSRLMAALKELPSDNRLLLTGTPLQNKLPELFSLLSYLSPSIFQDIDTFMDRFDTGSILQDNTFSKVQTMHSILKPFMLRRIKSEVEKGLPLLKEYVLTAPLTVRQAELYGAVLDKNIRSLLIRENAPDQIVPQPSSSTKIDDPEALTKEETEELNLLVNIYEAKKLRGKRSTTQRGGKDKTYFEQKDNDNVFLSKLEDVDERSPEELGRAFVLAKAVKAANAKKFGNPLMQLRKIANHPYLLDGGYIPGTQERILDKTLMTQSGKMLLLDRLLDGLFKKGHKVLIFSQFTETLDLLEDWADFKSIATFRLDGQTSSEDRRHYMKEFNTKTGPDSVKLFLLSTRAGGEGISLLAADTVILFDSDWNPSKDLQAAARCHRIGQTKPVLVFRLISAGTIEGKILERAGEKRALEGLVIGQAVLQGQADEEDEDEEINDNEDESMDVALRRGSGTDTNASRRGSGNRGPTLEQLTETLLKKDFENVLLAQEGDTILSDEQLELLLDRSDETMLSKTSWIKKASALGDTKTGLDVFKSAKETDVNEDEAAGAFGEDEEPVEEESLVE